MQSIKLETVCFTRFLFWVWRLDWPVRNDAKEWFWKKNTMSRSNRCGRMVGRPRRTGKTSKDIYHQLKDMGFDGNFSADKFIIFMDTWTKMLYENYSKYYPNKRLFSLNRNWLQEAKILYFIEWWRFKELVGTSSPTSIMLGMTMVAYPMRIPMQEDLQVVQVIMNCMYSGCNFLLYTHF